MQTPSPYTINNQTIYGLSYFMVIRIDTNPKNFVHEFMVFVVYIIQLPEPQGTTLHTMASVLSIN